MTENDCSLYLSHPEQTGFTRFKFGLFVRCPHQSPALVFVQCQLDRYCSELAVVGLVLSLP